MKRFEGRVAIVTGAASGIGAGSAQLLASEGAKVACADLDVSGAERTVEQITKAGGAAFALKLDVTNPSDNDRAVKSIVDRYGALHVAVLNAGIASASNILETTIEEWDRVNAVNLRGVFLGLKSTGCAIRDSGGGSIIIMSSGAGLQGSGSMSAYCATKHGALGLMKSAAVDLAPHQIRVNAVCPGLIDTPILGPIHKNADGLGTFGKAHPIGRVGQPEEVARVVAFLASEEASFITASAYPVDGGIVSILSGLSGDGQVGNAVNDG